MTIRETIRVLGLCLSLLGPCHGAMDMDGDTGARVSGHAAAPAMVGETWSPWSEEAAAAALASMASAAATPYEEPVGTLYEEPVGTLSNLKGFLNPMMEWLLGPKAVDKPELNDTIMLAKQIKPGENRETRFPPKEEIIRIAQEAGFTFFSNRYFIKTQSNSNTWIRYLCFIHDRYKAEIGSDINVPQKNPVSGTWAKHRAQSACPLEAARQEVAGWLKELQVTDPSTNGWDHDTALRDRLKAQQRSLQENPLLSPVHTHIRKKWQDPFRIIKEWLEADQRNALLNPQGNPSVTKMLDLVNDVQGGGNLQNSGELANQMLVYMGLPQLEVRKNPTPVNIAVIVSGLYSYWRAIRLPYLQEDQTGTEDHPVAEAAEGFLDQFTRRGHIGLIGYLRTLDEHLNSLGLASTEAALQWHNNVEQAKQRERVKLESLLRTEADRIRREESRDMNDEDLTRFLEIQKQNPLRIEISESKSKNKRKLGVASSASAPAPAPKRHKKT